MVSIVVVILVAAGVIAAGVIGVATAHWHSPRSGRTIHLAPSRFARNHILLIHHFLTSDTPITKHLLGVLTPPRRERKAVAKVVATLARTVAECRRERIGELSRHWQLDLYLLSTIRHTRGTRQREALFLLRHLAPTSAIAAELDLSAPHSPATAIELMLLHLAAEPTRLLHLLDSHPYPLGWGDMEQIVEVLHSHSPSLEAPPNPLSAESRNVSLYRLYIAFSEGIGSPYDLANEFADHPDKELRRAAYNILLEERSIPPWGEHCRSER